MRWHLIPSTLLSYVTTSLQHLRMAFSHHNSYVMTELVVFTQPFRPVLFFFTISLLEQGYVAQDWRHHYRIFMVVIMIITVYLSTPCEPICSQCHSFSSNVSYSPDFIWLLMGNSTGVFRIAADAYPTGVSGLYSLFLFLSESQIDSLDYF